MELNFYNSTIWIIPDFIFLDTKISCVFKKYCQVNKRFAENLKKFFPTHLIFKSI